MELCIDFGGTEIKLAVIADARILASGTIPVQGRAADLAAAAAGARRLLAETDRDADAVGIAVPGVVDPVSGRMLHANAKYDFLRDYDLNAWSLREFGVPAVVENDARAALVGETSIGSAAGERDAVLVTLGTGIGTAAMIDGIALRGRTGHAGILGGHITVDIDGPTCPCGNIGCGEALASARALGASTGSATQTRSSAAQASGPAAQMTGPATQATGSAAQTTGPATQATGSATQTTGSATQTTGPATRIEMSEVFADGEHRDVRDRFLHVWGAVVTTLVHSYDPAVVILSGGILRAGAAVLEPIETHVRTHLWPSMTAPRFIVPPEPELSVARGLSVLARAATPHPDATHPLQEEQ